MFPTAQHLVLLLLTSIQPHTVNSNDDGLALTPPLGWRSWNLYDGSIDQPKMESIMHGMVRKHTRPDHTGAYVSLWDIGYRDVGLDDLWQDGHSTKAAEGMHYHDINGNPLVNIQRFPSLSNMTDLAHSLNLSAGWYANNCAYSDHCRNSSECELQIRGDVQALLAYGFDALKIDGCGNETNLTLWNQVIKEKSNHIVVENCHGETPEFKPNRTLPPSVGCPYHFYRTSHDIRNNYGSIMYNLGTLQPYHQRNDSYPGCWAYPDMLMVGVDHGNGPGLNWEETRSHFAAWAIVSSPLTLSHNVNNETITDRIWDLLSNREILNVNQAYVGDSGGVYFQSPRLVNITGGRQTYHIPSSQYFYKPIGDGKLAVLLMNSDASTQLLRTSFRSIPNHVCEDGGATCTYHVYDLWEHRPMGVFQDFLEADVQSHDAAFVLLEPVKMLQ